MKYKVVVYPSRVWDEFWTLSDARKEARRVLRGNSMASYVVIRKDGIPFEQAYRIYNLSHNRTRVGFARMEG